MAIRKHLTTEALKKRFPQEGVFDIVNYAIDVAKNMVLTGRESTVDTDVENRAFQVLEELVAKKEIFAEMPRSKEEEFPSLQAPSREAIVQAAQEIREDHKAPAKG